MARPEGMGYDRYLLDGERVVVALHRHWAMVAKPVAASVVGLVFATWVEVITPAGAKIISTAVWWLWLALVAWTVWQLVGWRREWFLATDKRLILTQGLIAKNVAMMPLTKVTDLSYVRSIPGRVVGYGQFVLESAGQDQALREVSWIPQPDETYRAICTELFGSPDDDAPRRTGEEQAQRRTDDDDGGGWAPVWLTKEPEESTGGWVERATPSAVVENGDYSRAVPVSTSSPLPQYDVSHELYEPWEPDPVWASDTGDTGDTGYTDGAASDDEWREVGDDRARRPRRPDDTGPIHRAAESTRYDD